MTAPIAFRHFRNCRPATDEHVAQVLVQPGFGQHFTDHMVTVEYKRGHGWHDAAVRPHEPLSVLPGTAVFHYGQAVFEGLKAYRQPDGSVAVLPAGHERHEVPRVRPGVSRCPSYQMKRS